MSATTNASLPEDSPRIYSRELVFLLCVLSLLLLVVITAFLSRMYHKQVHTLADGWFAQGERDMQAGNVPAALTDYRNALVYNPSNTRFQFSLAKALAAAGHGDEARAYLLNLLSESPGKGEVNLELARVAAHNNQTPDAVRYYQGAIYGEWDADPIATRWQIRRELCGFLLDHGFMKQATPEVIALVENTPPDDTQRLKIVGQFLLRTQQWTRAQELYRDLLAADRYDEEALAGAAKTAFELGQYSDALQYFNRLPHERRDAPDLAGSYDMSRRVLAVDPFVSGLSAKDKAQRATDALTLAQTRLQNCARQNGESLLETPPRTDLQISGRSSSGCKATGTSATSSVFRNAWMPRWSLYSALKTPPQNPAANRKATIARFGCSDAALPW